MLIYENHSAVAVIVLHEIYGINSHIKKVCTTYENYGFTVLAPNLLPGKEPFAYWQEDIAYAYFMAHVGFASALQQVKELLSQVRPQYKQVYVLGYSVGATIAWLCSNTGLCDAIIGYYGSRIRDYLTVEPLCPSLLLFPQKENSFSVDKLMISLRPQANVCCKQLAGQHGFADPFAKNYNKKSAKAACCQIRRFIRDHNL